MSKGNYNTATGMLSHYEELTTKKRVQRFMLIDKDRMLGLLAEIEEIAENERSTIDINITKKRINLIRLKIKNSQTDERVNNVRAVA